MFDSLTVIYWMINLILWAYKLFIISGQQIQQMKDSQEIKKSSLWKHVHQYQTPVNPETDIKGVNIQQPPSLKHSKGLGIGKKYVQQCIFRRQPQKQKKHKQITQQFIKSSRVYRALSEQLRAQNQIHRQQMLRLAKINEQTRKSKAQAFRNMDELNKQIWSLQNQILQLSNAIQEQQQLKLRLVQQYEGGGNLDENQQEQLNAQNYMQQQQERSMDQTQLDRLHQLMQPQQNDSHPQIYSQLNKKQSHHPKYESQDQQKFQNSKNSDRL